MVADDRHETKFIPSHLNKFTFTDVVRQFTATLAIPVIPSNYVMQIRPGIVDSPLWQTEWRNVCAVVLDSKLQAAQPSPELRSAKLRQVGIIDHIGFLFRSKVAIVLMADYLDQCGLSKAQNLHDFRASLVLASTSSSPAPIVIDLTKIKEEFPELAEAVPSEAVAAEANKSTDMDTTPT